ncbi:fasciclin domain-containing protein [Luteolibacter flavescens]|uniref:Fasciclin domain-containing protein n=1 Tax=Luteolibacter flavescens TaxID=1859460 RepID=A0ABT3FQT3_9BACT|nr:fasciclin domain-containing protein [Luteolibacter flavescens]MCW1885943.1 fasciclin domain-containing protein [Luteolibacter flavescens]
MKTTAKTITSFAAALIFGTGLAQNDPVRPVAPKEQPKDVLGVIAAKPELSLFADAIKASGVEDSLRRNGRFTVLAPTNDAFRALPEGTMTELSKPENRALLAGIIQYHILRGEMKTGDISTEDVPTLQGSRVVLKKSDGIVWVGRGEVLDADIEATNGVVHVINMVLEPDTE